MTELCEDVASTSKHLLASLSLSKATEKPGSDDEGHDLEPSTKKRVSLADEELKKLLLNGGNEPDTHEGMMIHFDKYWPYPMKIKDEPENKQLLLIARYRTCKKEGCKLCNLPKNNLVELKPCRRVQRLDGARRLIFEVYPLDDTDGNGKKEAIRRLKVKAGEPEDAKDFKYSEELYLMPVGGAFEQEAVQMFCNESHSCEFHYHSEIFRIFYHRQTLHVYLDLNTSEDQILRAFKTSVSKKQEWANLFFRGRLGEGHFDLTLPSDYDDKVNNFRITGTDDFPEAMLPEGFKLTLRPDQLRTLSWMMTVEACPDHEQVRIKNVKTRAGKPVKARLGSTNIYLDLMGGIATKNPYTSPAEPVKIKGGILADDTGTGKTITCLALIHSMPFNEERAKARALAIRHTLPYKIPSWATCIVCPSNLYKQWLNEAVRCNPNFRILGLSNVREYDKMTWKDIMTADIVLVTCQFLLNPNYRNRKYGISDLMRELKEHLDEPGRIDLDLIQFHRLIFDEIHEYDVQAGKLSDEILDLKADSYWGMTGTPPEVKKVSFTRIIKYLVDGEDASVFDSCIPNLGEFIAKLVKRNVPDLNLPPISQEVIWVKATPVELALMCAVNRKFTTEVRIMMCSHYQISDEITRLCGESLVTIEKVKAALEKKKHARLKEAEADMEAASAIIETAKLKKPSRGIPQRVIDRNLEKCEKELRIATREFNEATEDYEHFIESFKTVEEQERPLTDDMDMVKPNTLEGKGLEMTMYGSKLIALYNYISNLLESCPNSRIILFQQYQRLARHISTALDRLSIQHVRVTGNVYIRNEAIRRFQSSPDIRVCMLSSDDSVSGINLTQATHVILLHPFYTGLGEETDRAWEKQGICRAYRNGLKNPLKVVRFAVKGTVEEELTMKRLELKL